MDMTYIFYVPVSIYLVYKISIFMHIKIHMWKGKRLLMQRAQKAKMKDSVPQAGKQIFTPEDSS